MTQALLKATNVSFSYVGSEAAVFDGVNLELHPGQSLGLLGPNGAGKSTLLGMLTNTIHGERSGQVRIQDGLGSIGQAIGYATQDVALYPTLTVGENLVHMARLILGKARCAEAAERAVTEFRLEAIAGQRVQGLSGGQRRLAHLAVSFVHQPRIRLLDEPTTALDFETRNRIVALASQWCSDGCALLVTAHYPEDVEEFSTSISVLQDRRLLNIGSLEDFVQGKERELTVAIGEDGQTPTHVQHALGSGTASELVSIFGQLDPHANIRNITISGNRLRSLLEQNGSLSVVGEPLEGSERP